MALERRQAAANKAIVVGKGVLGANRSSNTRIEQSEVKSPSNTTVYTKGFESGGGPSVVGPLNLGDEVYSTDMDYGSDFSSESGANDLVNQTSSLVLD